MENSIYPFSLLPLLPLLLGFFFFSPYYQLKSNSFLSEFPRCVFTDVKDGLTDQRECRVRFLGIFSFHKLFGLFIEFSRQKRQRRGDTEYGRANSIGRGHLMSTDNNDNQDNAGSGEPREIRLASIKLPLLSVIELLHQIVRVCL